MNRLFLIACAPLLTLPAAAETVFDGYHEYYSSMPDSIFKHESNVKFEGPKAGMIVWKGHRLRMRRAVAFPGAIASDDDLGNRPVLYEQSNWACIEGQSSTSSGTAVRHFAVYLIDARNPGKATLFKLPTLFASCLNVRLDQRGRFLFDRATYHYESGAELPGGVDFSGFVIDGKRFKPAGTKSSVEFVEEDNVWKFKTKCNP